MILAQKWDFSSRAYQPYEIPSDWTCVLDVDDMDTIINCASCGKKLLFGNGYTSRCIHNGCGFGYSVCADCYTNEIKAEKAADKEEEHSED